MNCRRQGTWAEHSQAQGKVDVRVNFGWRGDRNVIDRLALPIELPYDALAEYCRRWKITKLEVFGSVLREDFGPDSDVDFLVTFDPAARWTLFDFIHAQNELGALIQRPVDLVSRRPIEKSENWIRRRAILDKARTIYVG